MLPAPLLNALLHNPPAVPLPLETHGRRETNNATRRFFDEAAQQENPACAALAGAFQSGTIVTALQAMCGTQLGGTYLRIEYCQDMGGFWLEPHTDIGAKRLTLLIYLASPPDGECWGTDLLHADGSLAIRASGAANSGVLFIPGANTWHGFAPRPITGVRRTLIVNYVVPDWRARHELSFPATAIR
jgi:hypothetical protein